MDFCKLSVDGLDFVPTKIEEMSKKGWAPLWAPQEDDVMRDAFVQVIVDPDVLRRYPSYGPMQKPKNSIVNWFGRSEIATAVGLILNAIFQRGFFSGYSHIDTQLHSHIGPGMKAPSPSSTIEFEFRKVKKTMSSLWHTWAKDKLDPLIDTSWTTAEKASSKISKTKKESAKSVINVPAKTRIKHKPSKVRARRTSKRR